MQGGKRPKLAGLFTHVQRVSPLLERLLDHELGFTLNRSIGQKWKREKYGPL